MIAAKLNRVLSPAAVSVDKALKTCADARAALEALNSYDGGPSVIQAKSALATAERALNGKQAEDVALRRIGRSIPEAEIARLQRERDEAKNAFDEAQRFADGRDLAREALRTELSAAHERLSSAVAEATATLRREAEVNFRAAIEQLRDSIHVIDQLENTFRSDKVKLPEVGQPHFWHSMKPSPEILAQLEPYLPALRERNISLARLLR
jgi:uncharacterized protein YnzC (UPF0291/DUF896 family)